MEVIYISGYGRSGSTLLDILLGNAPGIVGVGELDLLARDWEARGCSCGAAYEACPFWSRVRRLTDEATGEHSLASREKILRRVENLPVFPALLAGLLPAQRKSEYRTFVHAELAAIAAVSGCDAILDSSKSAREAAGRAFALRHVAGVDVRVLHLVRDGRAVLWSVKRGDNVRLGEGAEGEGAAFSFPTVRALGGWVLANLLALVTRAALGPRAVLTVRYEDLVRDPSAELRRIGTFLGRDLGAVIERVERGESFPVSHNTGGNRLRKAGAVRIREDREWETKLGRPERALYWTFGWPIALATHRSATKVPRLPK